MHEIYLDQQKKDYYISDFTENVLTETDEWCKLKESIKPFFIELNKSKNIQSLFAIFPDVSMQKNVSYIKIAYTRDIELTLLREILPDFIFRYNQPTDESKFYYSFSRPKDNELYEEGNVNFKMGCYSNPDYFRINHFQLTFECFHESKRNEFWEDLKFAFYRFTGEAVCG